MYILNCQLLGATTAAATSITTATTTTTAAAAADYRQLLFLTRWIFQGSFWLFSMFMATLTPDIYKYPICNHMDTADCRLYNVLAKYYS